MYRLMIFFLCCGFHISGFAQSEIPKVPNSNKKISVLKKSYDSWYNDMSKPDCRVVGFSFTNEIIQSETIILKSKEQLEYCQEGKKGIKCQSLEPGLLYTKDVRIEIHPALKMYPWEYNKFKVCLKGKNLYVKQIETAYNYKVSKSNIGNMTLFIAEPIKKIKMDPDREGLSFNSVDYKNETIILNLSDKWSNYYTGKTETKMSLFKENFWLLKDTHIGDYSSSNLPDDLYKITLSTEVTGELNSGSYYFKWSFRRIEDDVSNPILIDKGETPVFEIK